MLAIFMVMATITVYFYVGETMGLQKAQKKLLFVPGAPWGRKLKEGEIPHSPAPLDRHGKYNLVQQQKDRNQTLNLTTTSASTTNTTMP